MNDGRRCEGRDGGAKDVFKIKRREGKSNCELQEIREEI